MQDVFKRFFSQFPDIDSMTDEEKAAYDDNVDRKEQRETEKEKQRQYEKTGVPERYWQESLETYQVETDVMQAAKSAAVAFAQAVKAGKYRTLVLLGDNGTGKTHLSCGVLRETGGKFITADELIDDLRHAESFGAKETKKDVIRRYTAERVLVIDEVGKEANAVEEKSRLYQVFNAAYNVRQSVVITSNFNKAEFLRFVGVSFADRLVESGKIIEIKGNSYRQRLREEMK